MIYPDLRGHEVVKKRPKEFIEGFLLVLFCFDLFIYGGEDGGDFLLGGGEREGDFDIFYELLI